MLIDACKLINVRVLIDMHELIVTCVLIDAHELIDARVLIDACELIGAHELTVERVGHLIRRFASGACRRQIILLDSDNNVRRLLSVSSCVWIPIGIFRRLQIPPPKYSRLILL